MSLLVSVCTQRLQHLTVSQRMQRIKPSSSDQVGACSEVAFICPEPNQVPCRTAEVVAGTLRDILEYRNCSGSVNLYMAHGGTSFGAWAGRNGEEADMTSYDYDCTVGENGSTGQLGIGGASKFEVRAHLSSKRAQ